VQHYAAASSTRLAAGSRRRLPAGRRPATRHRRRGGAGLAGNPCCATRRRDPQRRGVHRARSGSRGCTSCRAGHELPELFDGLLTSATTSALSEEYDLGASGSSATFLGVLAHRCHQYRSTRGRTDWRGSAPNGRAGGRKRPQTDRGGGPNAPSSPVERLAQTNATEGEL
jgi:hypothetical protein